MKRYIMFAQHWLLQLRNVVIAIANPNPKIIDQEANMGYIRAEEILPIEIIEQIQQYVDGENIYIPRKADKRQEWGTGTSIKQELQVRNQKIYEDYLAGMKATELAKKYYLSTKSIQRIIREMRK